MQNIAVKGLISFGEECSIWFDGMWADLLTFCLDMKHLRIPLYDDTEIPYLIGLVIAPTNFFAQPSTQIFVELEEHSKTQFFSGHLDFCNFRNLPTDCAPRFIIPPAQTITFHTDVVRTRRLRIEALVVPGWVLDRLGEPMRKMYEDGDVATVYRYVLRTAPAAAHNSRTTTGQKCGDIVQQYLRSL